MIGSRNAAWLLVLGVLGAGCGKTNGAGDGPKTMTPGDGSGGNASDGGASAIDVPLTCPDAHPGPAPLARLNNTELNHSFLAQIPQVAASVALPFLLEGFDDPASDLTDNSVEDLSRLAHDVAQLLADPTSGATAFKGCDVISQGEEACRDQLMTPFLERAYRRAVTDDDRAEMNEVFATGKMLGGDFASGMRAVAEVALQSPDFVYLLEQGTGLGQGDALLLTGFETAARLAYFLTSAPPDAELFAAAKKGPLAPVDIEAQARRLLGTVPGRALVGGYYQRLFQFADRGTAPELGFTADILKLADEETSRFVEGVVFDGAGTLGALLSDASTWVNEPLAKFYGYPGVTGEAFQQVQLDPSQRRGLFTQMAFLRSYSQRNTNPVQRGVAVLKNVLCYESPPPPPDVNNIPPDPPQDGTLRQRLTAFTADPVCQTCHHDINPVGFAFEHYDAVGRWRDADNGQPVDASGELYMSDAKGRFNGAPELLQHLADSDDAKTCFVHQWLEQAYRRAETPEDACSKAELSKAFLDSNGNVVELLLGLTKSDNFRYRLKSELAP